MVQVQVSVAHIEANLALLRSTENPATLELHFGANMLMQADSDSAYNIDITPRPVIKLTAEEMFMSEDQVRAYRMSRNLPLYCSMNWAIEHGRSQRRHIEFRSILQPSLLAPFEGKRIPHGPPNIKPKRKAGLPGPGTCARQIGQPAALIAFAEALAAGKIDELDCAAQSAVLMQPGREYTFDDLFDKSSYPYDKSIGDCCLTHYKAVKNRQRVSRSDVATHFISHKRRLLMEQTSGAWPAKPRLSLKKLHKSSRLRTSQVAAGDLSAVLDAAGGCLLDALDNSPDTLGGSSDALDSWSDALAGSSEVVCSSSDPRNMVEDGSSSDTPDAYSSPGASTSSCSSGTTVLLSDSSSWGLPPRAWESTSTEGWASAHFRSESPPVMWGSSADSGGGLSESWDDEPSSCGVMGLDGAWGSGSQA
ncbi:hypothetical protein BD626DRAFT_539744 [Schizophyllum amplum]|uniref:Uncharacterized protein n=1 Tax=Schizophyllum amplum TaxID=97359 RepID=A0A550C2B4_9AGAR|nr:hypothetical protein BD626DRAFT_539744 [Auriculariopsis ampla]